MILKILASCSWLQLILVLFNLACIQCNCPFPKGEIKNGLYIYASSSDANEDIAPEFYALRFKCFTGYQRIGAKFIQCAGGEWSGVAPVCEKIKCFEPPVVENGIYKIHGGALQPLTIGTLVSYSCNNGYEMIDASAANLMCILHRGEDKAVWVGKMPFCQEMKNCSDPGVSTHGSRNGDCCLTGNTLQFSCDEDFELVGREEIVCLPSGFWSHDRPLCRPLTEVHCELPPVIPNGAVVGEKEGDYFLSYEEAEIVCESGYSFKGITKYIMCEENGQWEAEFGECTEIYCDRPEPLINGTIPELEPTDLLRLPHNFELTYICDEGYRLLGGDSWRICRKNGWSGTTPYCEETRCPDPGVPENGHREGMSFVVGAKVRFRCSDGYYLLGSCERYCMPNGQWTGELSRCDTSNNYCPNPGVPINGFKNSTRYDVGDKVGFRCQSGYIHIGSEARECLPNKTWSGTETKCLSPYDYDNTAQVGEFLKAKVDERFDEEFRALQNIALYQQASSKLMLNDVRRGRTLALGYHGKLVIYFAFDVSGSVGRHNFEKSIEFAKAIVRKVKVRQDRTHIGAVTFSSKARNAFLPMHFNTTEDVLNELGKINYTGGGTAASSALSLIRNNIYLEERLLGEENRKTAVFVITDGKANMGGSPEEEAKNLKDKGVEIFCIGITGDVQMESLYKIASTSLYSNVERPNVFILKDYKAFPWLIQHITNGTVDYSQCGLGMENIINDNRGRILDGAHSVEPWPWMAALFSLKSGNAAETKLMCGGSVINENFILTAAHCMYEFNITTFDYRQRKKEEILIKLGLTDIKDESKWTIVQDFNVKLMYIHPKYKAGPSFDYDIALLQLDRPIKYDSYIRPICLPPKELPSNSRLYSPNEFGWVTGWGHEGVVVPHQADYFFRMSKNLKEIKLPIQSRERCVKSLEDKNYNSSDFTERMFCAGDGQVGNDACYGDSGGPLVQHQMNEEGYFYWTQVGIVSWGTGCGVKDLYGYYTHVHNLLSWIEDTTQTLNV